MSGLDGGGESNDFCNEGGDSLFHTSDEGRLESESSSACTLDIDRSITSALSLPQLYEKAFNEIALVSNASLL